MLYGELGRFPISLTIKKRMVSYWCKLVSGSVNKLSSILYRILLGDFMEETYTYEWLTSIKCIFEEVGMSHIWIMLNCENRKWLILNIQNI